MTVLAAVGFGYCARHLVATRPDAFKRVIATARSPAGVAALPAEVEGFQFDGERLSVPLATALAEAEVLIVSAPPDAAGDPVLRHAGAALATGRLRQVIYLTTLGVYGDHQGGWVDEASPARAGTERLDRRLAAEAAWFAFGRRHGVAVAALRLAGIYGPGRNVLVQLQAGEARIIDRPGQVFNRIHVEDISRAIGAVVARRFDGVLNVADDLPTAPGEPVSYGAGLLGLAPPPAIPFAEAARTMTPMALSFWGASKRVSNHRLKAALGVQLAYPTYREGLDALAAAGEGR
ncbi:Rossmann-fold NAD(P)-binding domain-containing protein [Xanthobacter agilis]|uniref:Nucleoside-diphosphate-sugar epimerase n=1 Tax=Xanthobacter agilis TaxID=47492 RepID=A0ABU0LF63_XANAG|nr:SDR family NAD(P)-dependent oxidoreductase [Xanthobacter agilis]MDQ0505773.1 nucleoside-diphosphate-sugar epimerase [Xanthobacter agilis]